MNKGTRRGHRRRRQSYLQQRGARNTLDGASGLSSVSIKRYGGTPSPNQPEMEGGACLLTAAPGRRIVARAIVGKFDLTSSAGVDGVDLVVTVGSVLARVGYPLAAGRVGRVVLLRSVVGNFELTSSTWFDGVDLEVTVGSVLARVDYLFAAGRVGWRVVVRAVVGEFDLTPTAGLDGVDLGVVAVVALIGYLAWFARKVGLCRLGVKNHHQSHGRQQPRHCNCKQRCSLVVEPDRLHYFPPSEGRSGVLLPATHLQLWAL